MPGSKNTLSDVSMPLFSRGAVEALDADKGMQHKLPSYMKDHRQRLRERFDAGGAAAMPDYELLEMILFRPLHRQDVKPLARRLIEAFGDLSAVLSAPPARLRAIEGVGAAVITEFKLIEACAQRMARAKVLNRPVLSSWSALLDYCHTAM
jgi:DNA repair protein RadC